MAMYRREEVPTTTSWIHTLNAQQALAQCVELGIAPSATLEENRVNLRRYVRDNVQVRAPQPVVSQAQHSIQNVMDLDALMMGAIGDFCSPPINPPPAQISPPNSHLNQLVESFTNPQVIPLPPSYTQVAASDSIAAPLRIPDQLLMQMRELTTEAVCQTARAFTELQRPRGQEDANVPHFIRDMIKDLPKCDGGNIRTTVNFLKGVAKLLSLNLAQERAILLNATTQTLEPFRQFWVESVAASYAWEQVLARFRDFFLTPEKLRLARNDILYRVQRPAEKLADYVTDLETAYQILAPQTTTEEVFQTIFCRLNSETRNCLAGLNIMRSTRDLMSASAIVESIKELVGATTTSQREDRPPPFPRQFDARQDRANGGRGHFGQARHFNPQHRGQGHNPQQRWHAPRTYHNSHSHTGPAVGQPQPFQGQGFGNAHQPAGLSFPFPPPNFPQQHQQPQHAQTRPNQGPPRDDGNLNSYARR